MTDTSSSSKPNSGQHFTVDAAADADLKYRALLAQLQDPNLRFPTCPAFVEDLDIFEMPDGLGIQFRGAESPVIIRGRSVVPVLQFLRAHLDGSTEVQGLLRSRPPEISPMVLLRSLLLLHAKGLLVSGVLISGNARPDRQPPLPEDPTAQRQLLFWGRHLDLTRSAASPLEVQRRLETSRVILVGAGLFGAVTTDLLVRTGCRNTQVIGWNDDGPLKRALSAMPTPLPSAVHLPTTSVDALRAELNDRMEEADLLLTATCDAPALMFRAVNDLCLAAGCPWLLGNTEGSVFQLGPLVEPYESACYSCLELRSRSGGSYAIENELYQERLATTRSASERILLGEALWPATLAASILVGEAVRLLSGLAATTLTNARLHLTPVTGLIEQNEVIRVPRCPDCYRGQLAPQAVPTVPPWAHESSG
jgi:bacteriocin biosynthesis cyclodehydratase domain-containing protein